MPRTTVNLADGRQVEAPTGAVWIGHAAAAVFSWLESIGRSRSNAALRDAATRLDARDPKLAAQIRAGIRSGPVRG